MPPPRPPTIATIGGTDTVRLMAALQEVRTAAGQCEVLLRRQSIHRAALVAFRSEIDELAGMITGDRTHFHGKNSA